jgi:hypothetical protein
MHTIALKTRIKSFLESLVYMLILLASLYFGWD